MYLCVFKPESPMLLCCLKGKPMVTAKVFMLKETEGAKNSQARMQIWMFEVSLHLTIIGLLIY